MTVVVASMAAVPRRVVRCLRVPFILVWDLSRLQAVVEVGMSLVASLLLLVLPLLVVVGWRELGLDNSVADRRR